MATQLLPSPGNNYSWHDFRMKISPAVSWSSLLGSSNEERIVWDWIETAVPSKHSPDYLLVARRLAWLANAWSSRSEVGRHFVYEWIRYVIDDESTRRAFLFHREVLQDRTLYNADGKIREEFEKDFPLPWLKKDEATRLSVPELELALVLFQWEQKTEKAMKPLLAAWAVEHPFILPRIESFLARRYCTVLEGHLHSAQQGDEKGWRARAMRYLRSLGRELLLALIGLLAVLSTGPLLDVFVRGSLWFSFAFALLSGIALTGLLQAHAKRMSAGLLNEAEVKRRGRQAARPFCLIGAGVAVLFGLAWDLGGAGEVFEGIRCSRPFVESAFDWLLRFTSLGVTAALTGGLIQWVWEDRSPTEPVFAD